MCRAKALHLISNFLKRDKRSTDASKLPNTFTNPKWYKVSFQRCLRDRIFTFANLHIKIFHFFYFWNHLLMYKQIWCLILLGSVVTRDDIGSSVKPVQQCPEGTLCLNIDTDWFCESIRLLHTSWRLLENPRKVVYDDVTVIYCKTQKTHINK